MARPLTDFLAAATANNIRSNNSYEVECTSGYDDIDKVLNKAVLFGSNFSLPERNTEFASISYKGMQFRNLVPTRMTMGGDHTITFASDFAGEYRRAFLAWQSKTINPAIAEGSKLEGDRKINTVSTIRVKLLGSDNETVVEVYRFYNVRIGSVGSMALSYDGADKASFQVTFKSSWWEIESASDGEFKEQH